MLKIVIIHQIHYEKSDWSRAFNQFKKACAPDMINAISAANNVTVDLTGGRGFDSHRSQKIFSLPRVVP